MSMCACVNGNIICILNHGEMVNHGQWNCHLLHRYLTAMVLVLVILSWDSWQSVPGKTIFCEMFLVFQTHESFIYFLFSAFTIVESMFNWRPLLGSWSLTLTSNPISVHIERNPNSWNLQLYSLSQRQNIYASPSVFCLFFISCSCSI